MLFFQGIIINKIPNADGEDMIQIIMIERISEIGTEFFTKFSFRYRRIVSIQNANFATWSKPPRIGKIKIPSVEILIFVFKIGRIKSCSSVIFKI